jgi:hypothetical protein
MYNYKEKKEYRNRKRFRFTENVFDLSFNSSSCQMKQATEIAEKLGISSPPFRKP